MQKSATFDSLLIGDADAVRDWLVSQLGQQQPDDRFGMFRERAIALVGAMAPMLVYLRDTMGIAIDIGTIQFALELKSLSMLVAHKRFLARDAETGEVSEIPVPDVHEKLISPLKSYLGELPGYDMAVPYNQQANDEPNQHHALGLYYFTVSFAQFPVTRARERAFERVQKPATLPESVSLQP